MPDPNESDHRSAAQQDEDALQSKGVRDALAVKALGTSDASVLRTEGQREINRLWESTQMRIALTVVGGGFITQNIVVASIVWNMLSDGTITPEMLTLLVTVLGTMGGTMGLIIGFYFSRTNHQKTGGVEKGDEGR